MEERLVPVQGFHSLINRYKGRGTSASGLMDWKPLIDLSGGKQHAGYDQDQPVP